MKGEGNGVRSLGRARGLVHACRYEMYSGLEGPDVLLERMQDGVWTDELSAHPLITVLDAEEAQRAQLQVP